MTAALDKTSPYLDRVRSAQVAMLVSTEQRTIPISLLVTVMLWSGLYYAGVAALPAAELWIGAHAAHAVLRLWLRRAYRRAAPGPSEWRGWIRTLTISSTAGGFITGFAALWALQPGQIEEQAFILIFYAGVGSVSVSNGATYLPAFYGFFLPGLLPSLVWCALQADALHYALSFAMAVFMAITASFAQQFNGHFIEAMRLRFANLDLVADLRREKEAAELANIAKSRFLASASHDLRQPVHALGMFVGALRVCEMGDEARRLVDHIERSVSATDSLFGSLLDISRLDAGIIQSHPCAFPIQALLERVCDDYTADADRKGVRLVLCPCSAIVESDPVLIERILRNIVSNAVRYTDHGRILVGCRRGAMISVDVWDTGRGIPSEHQENVFQEFYQLGNPERDRTKGLGLGLAIVRRLTALLDCPLGLRSVPGRGSVFKLGIPQAFPAISPLALPLPGLEPGSATAGSGLVLVLDDELAIQEAMRSLLESWGFTVITAGSFAEMLGQIATCPDRPALIICDYRLRGQENGISVIQWLQSEYNEDIPAMLITGDSAPDRLKEAQESGFVLLHKPVANSRLRAAIGHVLLSRAPAGAESAKS
jgi:two-component system, sensor histidine kinase